jgi:PiT family inorganic phosphate transporter
MRQALILGATTEFVGCMTLGPFVAGTIAGGEVKAASFEAEPNIFALIMLCATVSAGFTTLLATIFGLPVSATEAVVGAIVASGVASGVPGAVKWGGVGWTVCGWILSPLVGLATGCLVSLSLHKVKKN